MLRRLSPLILIIAILAVTGVAYSPALDAGFFFDDRPNILEATALHWEELPPKPWAEALKAPIHPERVVPNISFGLNYLWGEGDPRGYHLLNVMIHMFAGVGVAWAAFLIAGQTKWIGALRQGSDREQVGALTASILAAGLFLLHPLNTQAVTYVVQRMASLAALFSILAFCLYVSGRRARSTGFSVVMFALALVAWLLAVSSKQNALMLPVVVLAFELCFLRGTLRGRLGSMLDDRRGRWFLVGLLALLAISAIFFYRFYLSGIQLKWLETYPNRDFSGWERVLTQARVHWFYISLFFWPAPSRLNLDHHFIASRSLMEPATLIGSVLWVVAAAGIVWLVRKKPIYGFPFVAYLVLHAVESGPVNLELAFEHRMYLPLAFLLPLTAVLLVNLPAPVRALGRSVALVLLVPLAMSTYQRNVVWADSEALLRDCAMKSPAKFRSQYNLGTYLGERGLIAEAIPHLEKAVQIKPADSRAHNQLGSAYLSLGDRAGALSEYQAAVRLGPWNAEAQFNLGTLLDQLGRDEEALTAYETFIKVAPPYLSHWVGVAEARSRAISDRIPQ